jgi:hypothetical protein
MIKKTRLAGGLAMLIATACSLGQPSNKTGGGTPPVTRQPERKWLENIQDIQPVHLEKPASFWHDGAKIQVQDAVLIRIKVTNPGDFAPKDAPSPNFMYGRSVCQILVDPIFTNVAVVLAPPLPAGEKPVLWLSPGIAPEKLDRKLTDPYLEKLGGGDSVRSLAVPQPPATTKPSSYKDVEDLRQQLRSRSP